MHEETHLCDGISRDAAAGHRGYILPLFGRTLSQILQLLADVRSHILGGRRRHALPRQGFVTEEIRWQCGGQSLGQPSAQAVIDVSQSPGDVGEVAGEDMAFIRGTCGAWDQTRK